MHVQETSRVIQTRYLWHYWGRPLAKYRSSGFWAVHHLPLRVTFLHLKKTRLFSVTDTWLVLKFGGTSVSGRQQWETIATLAGQRIDDGNRVLLVCSAVAGITNALQALADNANDYDADEVSVILDRHRRLSDDLEVNLDGLIDKAGKEVCRLLGQIAAAEDENSRYRDIASLMSVGEWMSTRIGERYLARTLPVAWVDARQALQALEEPETSIKRSRLSARCESGVNQLLLQSWLKKPSLLITQGFIAEHPDGGTALLGRGGSDTSAALLASRLGAGHVEIWTDVPGLFSADPRVIPEARLLQTLNYDEALEMAASGAKVVHSRCIRAAADANIPVLVRDLGQPGFSGTTIQRDDRLSPKGMEGIRSVCCQSQMAVLLLQNLDTREHVGFLAWVFTQISEAGISVDLVATSETTTTLALNRVSNQVDDVTLDNLANCLRERCTVKVHPNCSGINLVGRGARVALKDIDSKAGFFAEHPLLMLSQSANDLCLSILLHAQDAEELLGILHRTLIEEDLDSEHRAAVFGPAWQDIQN
jgi:diaminopimelate decarboxylase/aspartate kinase